MENYQLLFPISSPAQVVSASYPQSIDMAPNSEAVFNNIFEGNMNGSSYGLEGLKTELVKEEEVNINVGSRGFGGSETAGGGAGNKKKAISKKIKKPKYAFQTRSQVDILDDGYRWRKYGQKAVKNNKFPRNYYRCTHQGCNVKKQVQRLTNDEGVVETTYEGMHTHPIEKPTDNFEHILSQMQIYTPF